jgi:hypothetical protein
MPTIGSHKLATLYQQLDAHYRVTQARHALPKDEVEIEQGIKKTNKIK